ATRIRRALSRKRGIEEKKMFGGVGFLLHGHMLVGVWKDSVVVRLDPEANDNALLEPHVSGFKITGRAMEGWVLVGPERVANDGQLKGWIQRAVDFVGRLPAKEK